MKRRVHSLESVTPTLDLVLFHRFPPVRKWQRSLGYVCEKDTPATGRATHLADRTLVALNQGAQCQTPTTPRTRDLLHGPHEHLADPEAFFP